MTNYVNLWGESAWNPPTSINPMHTPPCTPINAIDNPNWLHCGLCRRI